MKNTRKRYLFSIIFLLFVWGYISTVNLEQTLVLP
jgi:hypothetical protein